MGKISVKSDYYRDDPKNTPHDPNGNAIPGGPWLRIGETSDQHEGEYSADNGKYGIATVEKDCPPGKAAVFVGPTTDLNNEIMATYRYTATGDDGKPEQRRLFRPGHVNVGLAQGQRPANQAQADFLNETYKARQFQPSLFTLAVPVTGAKYKERGKDEVKTVPVVTEGKYLGTFRITPTKVLGIVDMDGQSHVMMDDGGHARKLLENNGFRETRTLEVPFSKGEVPVLPDRVYATMPEARVDHFRRIPAYQRGLASMSKEV